MELLGSYFVANVENSLCKLNEIDNPLPVNDCLRETSVYMTMNINSAIAAFGAKAKEKPSDLAAFTGKLHRLSATFNPITGYLNIQPNWSMCLMCWAGSLVSNLRKLSC